MVILEGQITNHIGAGEAEVLVTIRRKAADGDAGELIATTTTDEMGDFAVKVAEPVHGDVVVTFSKPKHTELVRQIHLDDEEYPPYLAETLEGNLILRGIITDASNDAPVAKASVTLRSLYRDWDATTDDQGRFTIKEVSPGQAALIVEATGYGREQYPIDQTERDDEINVRIKPERILHLVIVNDLEQPIFGVTIEAFDEERDDFRTIVSDRQGTAILRGIHYDAFELSVRLTHEDHVSSEGFDREISVPEKLTESTHQFVMSRAGRVTGTVTDGQTDRPLHGARIMTGTDHSDLSPRDWSDYQGGYTITGVTPGTATLTVHVSGFAPALNTVRVEAGKTTKLNFQLGPAATIDGIVTDDDGKPVVGAYVEATKWRDHNTLGLRAITDHDGRFTIANAPHDEFEVAVFRGRSEPVTKTVKAGPGQIVEIKLPIVSDLGPSALVTLKVGDPAPAVTMTALDGESFDLAKLEGKTILVDFWATWCVPCLADVPELKAVYDKFGARKDFLMIGVSLDWDEKAVQKFLKKHGITWPQVYGDTGRAQKAADSFGVTGLPAAFIVGPDGKIRAAGLAAAEIGKRLDELLKGPDR